ncbi:MAG: tRNA dihydrouridine(20/20a) synthase DusA [Betaproteobacteria bacterium]|nr:MAG: tRNA dihydrouridine(20/20a) synthase DusA [Betaproteobacteria bacterium]
MMDWSDRHCRYFFRQLAPHARVYTEMITTGALIHGDVARHLDFNQAEHPVALQLGGSEPSDLVRAAKLGESWGYDEINLNCGCPSERVQRGAFGACLMAEPKLVADCVSAIRDATSLAVTVKHRLGIDSIEDYDFVARFVETLVSAGCRTFIVHARNAILKGLSPKDNRQIPPLKYDYVYRLKSDFPHCDIVINGGINTADEAHAHLDQVDGVMLGRAAYHDSHVLAVLDGLLFGHQTPTRNEVVERMWRYAQSEVKRGTPLRAITRHMLGLYHGQPHARKWRQLLSDADRLASNDADLILLALEAVEPATMGADA